MDRRANLLGLVAVVALFCAPLFINLGGLDYRNDEAIYVYAVDRILETGEWLTPRSIQIDGPFLEKPPLKFWISAALIRLGVLPHDETGLRLLDAVCGAVGFLYVYFLGLRLAGPLCGVAATLTLFTFNALLFEHGLREYNMEAPLFLCYCGAIYHFTRWVEGSHTRLQAGATCAYFVLGFLTKFVAALFLPIIIVFAIAVTPLARRRFTSAWAEWVGPAVLTIAAVAPWFVYETVQFGQVFWDSIAGLHVYQRFTASLDPAHLNPWYYYFDATWEQFARTGSQFAAIAGVLALAITAWRGTPWQMRLLLTWWFVPYVLMSLAASKLIHYAYPFLPPIALGVGWVAVAVYEAGRHPSSMAWLERLLPARRDAARSRTLRWVLLGIAAVAVVLAIVAAVQGQTRWYVGGVKVFQNSSIARPALVAVMLLIIAGESKLGVRTLSALLWVLALPLLAYPRTVEQLLATDHRLRAIRDCALQVNAGRAAAGVRDARPTSRTHVPYYYLRRLAWTESPTINFTELSDRFFTEGKQSVVLMTTNDFLALERAPEKLAATQRLPPAVKLDETIVVVLPGPYAACVIDADSAGVKGVTRVDGRWQ